MYNTIELHNSVLSLFEEKNSHYYIMLFYKIMFKSYYPYYSNLNFFSKYNFFSHYSLRLVKKYKYNIYSVSLSYFIHVLKTTILSNYLVR